VVRDPGQQGAQQAALLRIQRSQQGVGGVGKLMASAAEHREAARARTIAAQHEQTA